MMDLFSELFDMFDGMDMFKAQPSAQQYGKACPVCGHTWNDFSRTGRFGCSECYKTFKSGAEQVLRQTQSGTHAGKIPSKSSAQIKAKRRLEDLRRQLKTAVSKEEYETAAKLHAEIKQLEAAANEGGASK